MHLVMSKICYVNDHVGSLFIWYCIDVIILKVTSECMCKDNWGWGQVVVVFLKYIHWDMCRAVWVDSTPEDSEKWKYFSSWLTQIKGKKCLSCKRFLGSMLCEVVQVYRCFIFNIVWHLYVQSHWHIQLRGSWGGTDSSGCWMTVSLFRILNVAAAAEIYDDVPVICWCQV